VSERPRDAIESTGRASAPASVRSILAMSLPAGVAIAVFGAIYAVAAVPLQGAALTVASSLLVFSGALQFALLVSLGAGAAAPALLLTAVTLNLRHLALGAILRARLEGGWPRRAGLAFFLVDETVGFALAAKHEPGRTVLVAGLVCYVAWQIGTVVGIFGLGFAAVRGVAGAIFPMLFIGLASLVARSRSDVARALAAAAVTLVLAWTVPELRTLAPVVAVAVAAVGRAKELAAEPEGRDA
jgi:predicted branched-subunit amino acid permease